MSDPEKTLREEAEEILARQDVDRIISLLETEADHEDYLNGF